MAAAMVDATYVDIAKAIRPGTRENELVAFANDRLFRMGSERVECVNSVSGPRGRPHSHTFSDRMRSEEHTSELQSLMRISYAVFCLKKTPRDSTHIATDTRYNYTEALVIHKR